MSSLSPPSSPPQLMSAVLEHHVGQDEELEHAFGTIMSPKFRRCVSADHVDDIRKSQIFLTRDEKDEFDVIPHRSENDHLSVVVARKMEKRKQAEIDFENAILSSRSLFDSRVVPPIVPPPPGSPVGGRHAGGPSLLIDPSKRWKLRLVRVIRIIQHYFIPLQLGILTAIIWANIDYQNYQQLWNPVGLDPHDFTFHFFVNDVFMTFFFGIAMVHVSTAVMEGGALYPIKRAMTPIMGTIGGVVGPAAIYLALVGIQGSFSSQYMGWAVCIATDISIAWLTAVQVFGDGTHPAIQFLLLLAVVDDVIGLIVIAVAFPVVETHPEWLGLLAASFAVSAALRWGLKANKWWWYVFLSGPVAWYSLYRAGVHPALALCVVIPFIPDRHNMEQFDHNCSLFVHIGLFFFALCNAGVQFNAIGFVTLNVAASLVLGKSLGIFFFTYLGMKIFGLVLPQNMKRRHLAITGTICSVGLTVALFVAELAFKDPELQNEAKLGALMTVLVTPLTIGVSKIFRLVK